MLPFLEAVQGVVEHTRRDARLEKFPDLDFINLVLVVHLFLKRRYLV